ncbi:DNA-directed RNA polymerase I and III subunit RPAC1 (macronuclear) [Tetrahymena thermophila SB210]|uniref:DNA-directed RNA polymerases I and III subunit RPAC1 n=1 Tax=Tetrahymena thermophila (strain SB210) TaxID=312017 RepID=Q235X0_TETTS|nr:DNA-directed RNA polymerase I and III subunit RPAC1 [Tetrahymena thermophila SB210]EAR92630.3 DNA-directed RNA polymerase I and III subunit RPAC1 [Tetrahymena thermophila SB210]|eukprot:XP_001012875.3 DNA-directed RNA polymerase I and III subunit RPAC1 [Tetrahymena thermophila SB210]
MSNKTQKMKKNIVFTNEGIQHSQEMNYSAAFTSEEDFNTFKENIKIEVIRYDNKNKELEFDLMGVDAPIANALRRIMIAEVPTMAIHKVYIYQNTSIIPDEVLAHRLGLIPIYADPRLFEEKQEEDEYNEKNSLKFTLKIKCSKKEQYKNYSEADLENLTPETYLENAIVYSGDFKWVSQGEQNKKFEENPIRMVHDNIIVAKLRENQEIICEVICQKGIGKTHAKWSPVCTAYYRLMPEININSDITGAKAQELKERCPLKVYDVQNNKAIVSNERACTMCRECIREDEEFNSKIELAKKKEHFIFTVESVGIYEPHEIVKEAIQILKQKASSFMLNL